MPGIFLGGQGPLPFFLSVCPIHLGFYFFLSSFHAFFSVLSYSLSLSLPPLRVLRRKQNRRICYCKRNMSTYMHRDRHPQIKLSDPDISSIHLLGPIHVFAAFSELGSNTLSVEIPCLGSLSKSRKHAKKIWCLFFSYHARRNLHQLEAYGLLEKSLSSV